MRVERQRLDEHRDGRHRRRTDNKLRSIDDAKAFVDEHGLVSLFGIKDLGLPSLFDATLDTKDANNTWWGWKDAICSDRSAFYGRLIQRKMFLSTWDLFKAFFALSGSSGETDEYLYEYKRGRLGVTAKNIYEHLLNQGPTATDRLRTAVRMSDKKMKGHFDKAMMDLQTMFLIAKVGTEQRGWGVDVWDILPRWIPDEVEASLTIKADDARSLILERYLLAAGAVPTDHLRKTMAWESLDFDRTLGGLVDRGLAVADVELGDELAPAVAHSDFMKSM